MTGVRSNANDHEQQRLEVLTEQQVEESMARLEYLEDERPFEWEEISTLARSHEALRSRVAVERDDHLRSVAAYKDVLESSEARCADLERALEEARDWLSPIAAPVPSEPGLRTSAAKALAVIDKALAAAPTREEGVSGVQPDAQPDSSGWCWKYDSIDGLSHVEVKADHPKPPYPGMVGIEIEETTYLADDAREIAKLLIRAADKSDAMNKAAFSKARPEDANELLRGEWVSGAEPGEER